ncbi:MAG TPA: hypothetical protein VN704_03915 [Verrucomicrobiae bacterium]|jgi:hypothetical protein|nr:hypothetical protein [Verrucomicrobiae bacterium]
MSSSEEQKQNIEKMASAIEDLLYMKVIEFADTLKNGEKRAILSAQFSIIVANIMADRNLSSKESASSEIMKLMYYSLLIYMNESLKVPRSLTMAFGNDLEKHREGMQCAELISNYITVLQNVFSDNKKDKKKANGL